jgi:formate hydrogenlyase transcriptional activator
VRVIAATNRDLGAAVDAGIFRLDLFYRLNVFPIQVPPLRERPEDVLALVKYFIDRYSRNTGRKIRNIERKTLELLRAYDWPGNIRELQNMVEQAVIVLTGRPSRLTKPGLSPKSWERPSGQSLFRLRS